jgi:hypothetical protein
MIRAGEMNFYNELAVNAGQRCITSATPVTTNNGVMPIGHMMLGHDSPGFHKPRLNYNAHNGREIKKVSQVYVSKESPTRIITLSNGQHVETTHEHPLRTEQGFKKALRLHVGDKLEVTLGINAWGKIQHPVTIYDAGKAPREAALRFIADRSLPIGDQMQYVTEDEDAAQMVWSILINAGYLPQVKQDKGYCIQFDLNSECHRRSIHLPVISIEEGEPKITYDLQMEGLPQFVASGLISPQQR